MRTSQKNTIQYRKTLGVVLTGLVVCILLCRADANKETKQIEWKTSWKEAADAAQKNSSLIMVLFTNPERCPPCRMMEENTWPHAAVVQFVTKHFVPLKIHTGNATERSLGSLFKIQGIPTTLVTDSQKTVLARKTGFVPPKDIIPFLQSAVALKTLEKKVAGNDSTVTDTLDLAKAYVELGQKEKASYLLEKVCTLDKDNAKGKKIDALYLQGKIAAENKEIAVAQKKFEQVQKLDPKARTEYADDAALQLALMTANKRNFSDAAAQLNKFVAAFPKSELRPEAMLYLARCHMLAENKAAAITSLKTLVKEYPDNPFSKYAERMLKSLKQSNKK